MAYENLKTVANQVTGQMNQGLASFMPQATPLQTDILTKILPMGGASWKGFNPIQTPAETQQNQQAMSDAYKDMRSQGLNSQTIGRNLANGVYEGGTNFVPQVSETTQNALSGMTTSSGIKKPESPAPTPQQQRAINKASRQAARQERKQEQKEWEGSAEGQTAMANVPSGTGNTTIDAFNSFSAIKNAPSFEKESGAAAWASSKAGLGVAGAVNLAAGGLNALADAGIGAESKRPEAQQLNETQEAARQVAYSGVSMIPGFGPLISGGLQLIDGLGKLTGTQMSNISKDAAEDAGISRGLNNVVATLPGIGSVLGAFTKKTDEFKVDMDKLAGVGSAYDMSTFDSAKDLSGGLFLGQRNKVNDFIAEQNKFKDITTGISDTQRRRKEGMGAAAADLAQQNKNRYAGVTGGSMAIGKKGMKFNLDNSRALLQRFQKGGKLGIDTNIIVEGSYHAHKNHLDEINPELGEMTPKGIPVAAQDKSGNKVQVAEIERKELILTKELTDKIEALYHDGSEEAMVEAGMLFVNELFNNTQDNTGEVLNGAA